MKQIKTLIIFTFSFVLFNFLISCRCCKKNAFFHNSYPSYVAKKSTQENLYASTKSKVDESFLIRKPVLEISKQENSEVLDIKPKAVAIEKKIEAGPESVTRRDQ